MQRIILEKYETLRDRINAGELPKLPTEVLRVLDIDLPNIQKKYDKLILVVPDTVLSSYFNDLEPLEI